MIPIPCSVFIYFRQDALTATAGEIQESIRAGLEARAIYISDEFEILAKHVKHEHARFEKGALVDEKKRLPGVDVHVVRFALELRVKTKAEMAEANQAEASAT